LVAEEGENGKGDVFNRFPILGMDGAGQFIPPPSLTAFTATWRHF
jgi:hypothetical protein